MKTLSLLGIALLLVGSSACNSTDLFGGGLTADTIARGLKEALSVGTGNAVAETSKAGGFSNNPLRYIGLPGKLDDVAKTLRGIGMGGMLDELEKKMNVAAEQASSQAGPIFIDAVKEMTFADARKILDGSDTAATEYFRAKTGDKLTTLYAPVIRQTMNEVGVIQQYNDLIGQFTAIPFMKKPDFSIENYVTGKALDGLFGVLATEEKKIRTDPAARVTALLQQVFAGK